MICQMCLVPSRKEDTFYFWRHHVDYVHTDWFAVCYACLENAQKVWRTCNFFPQPLTPEEIAMVEIMER